MLYLNKIIKFFQDSPLVFKLSTSIIISVIVGSMFLSMFVSNYSKPLLKEQVISEAYKTLGEVNYDLAQGANIVEQSLVNTSNILALKDRPSDEDLLILSKAALQSIENQYGFFYEFWIYVSADNYKKTGILYHSYIKNGKLTTTLWQESDFIKDREWFKSALEYGKIHWSEPYISVDPNNNKLLSTTVSMPFKFKGSIKWNGVIAASGNLEAFREKMAEQNFGALGKFLFISSKGLYLIHPDKNIEMKKTIYDLAKDLNMPKLAYAANQIKENKSGFVVMPKSSVHNGDVVFVYMPVPKTNWGSFLVFSSANFYKPIKHFQAITISVIMISLIFLMLLINHICKLTTNPIVKLANVANKYGKGEFSAELPPINSNDEIGILTQAFYKMKDNLLNLMQIQKENTKEEQKRASELEISAKIQTSALPADYPDTDIFNIWATMHPAKEVGGDFYDFFFIDTNHFAFLIADVSGKGIPAALFMMNIKSLLKSNLKSGYSLKAAIEKTNNELCKTNNAKMFVTAFIAILNTQNGNLEYVNAGHNPPLIKSNGKYEFLNTDTNLVLSAIEDMEYKTSSVQLKQNEGIFLYTDGVVEAHNINDEFYSENRLKNYLNDNKDYNPKELLIHLKENIDEFCKGASQFDDITMLNIIFNKINT